MTAPGCLDPDNCPVPEPTDIDLRRLRVAHLDAGRSFHTAYRVAQWPALFNPSERGDGRFSPLRQGGRVVPTLYGAASQTVALLETAFHDLHDRGTRLVSEAVDVAPRGLVALSAPDRLPVMDLRNLQLDRLGLARAQLLSTSRAHYPCTRAWAEALHGRSVGRAKPVGLVWQSRVAELAQADSPLLEDLLTGENSEAFVLFGDLVSRDPRHWRPGAPHFPDLTQGVGRLLVDEIAERLGAVVVPP